MLGFVWALRGCLFVQFGLAIPWHKAMMLCLHVECLSHPLSGSGKVPNAIYVLAPFNVIDTF